MRKSKSHHHGNLRAALIEAGLTLLNTEGPQALTVRGLAKIAGVSHAAPAHHFANLEQLKSALAAEGFIKFRQSMIFHIERADDDARKKILAAGYGYLDFAKNHTGLFNLMFGGMEYDRTNAQIQKASQSAYNVLSEVCAPLATQNSSDHENSEVNELMVWSIVHGLAGLMLNDKSGRISPDNIHAILDSILPPLKFKS